MKTVFLKSYKTILLFFLLFLLPVALNKPFIYTILNVSGINALTVLGLLLLVGYAGQISFGHAGFMALGAYTSAIVVVKLNMPVLIGVLSGFIITSIIAGLLAIPVLKLKGYYLAMATLAFGIIFSKLVIELKELTGGPVGIGEIPPFSVGDLILHGEEAYFILIWSIVFIVYQFCKNIEASHIGRMLKGINTDEDVVSCLGVDVKRIKIIVFVFSAVLASLSGSLYAHYMKYISPEVFSADNSVFLIMMVFLGGTRYVWGALLGSLLLNFLPEVLRAYKDYSIGLYGLALVFIVLLMPEGLSAFLVKVYAIISKSFKIQNGVPS
jgi:branched-chain amino acid transport system permease protein